MDTNRAPATAVDRALALPEIVAIIKQHLPPADILACSAVSRILRQSFAPYVWQDLHFGPPWLCNRDAYPRWISSGRLPDVVTHTAARSRTESRKQILTTFKDIAPRIRTLTIHNHESPFPLQLGSACSQLQSLSISGLSARDTGSITTPAHWIYCKEMMKRNRDHLRSLALFHWNNDRDEKPRAGQPNWNPILGCTKSFDLLSLDLQDCSIRGRHMEAFWIVCSRLETLSMDNVQLHLELPHPSPARRNKNAITKDHPENYPFNMTTATRFPRLKSLTLKRMSRPHILCQLDLLVCSCPALQSLDWTMGRRQEFPIQPFIDCLMSSTWPELDTLLIRFPYFCATDDQFREILLAAKHPLRMLALNRAAMTPETFSVYRERHFDALETIDIGDCQGNTSQWTMDLLTLCPRLRKLSSWCLNAEDIFQSNKPWVCYGLQEMRTFINMDFQNRGNYRRFTEEELDKCRVVFKHLATLKELQVLDLLSSYFNLHSYDFTSVNRKPALEDRLVPLPLRLKAGLGLLEGLRKLRIVGYWSGRHKMPMKELNWMVQHWRRLERLTGGWVVLITPPMGTINNPWKREQTTWLKEHRISTTGARYDHYQNWDPDVYYCEDWCGLSDGDPEEGVGSGS